MNDELSFIYFSLRVYFIKVFDRLYKKSPLRKQRTFFMYLIALSRRANLRVVISY